MQRLNGLVDRSEILVDRGLLWNLQFGDRRLVRCFLNSESLKLAPALPDINSENVIDCVEVFNTKG